MDLVSNMRVRPTCEHLDAHAKNSKFKTLKRCYICLEDGELDFGSREGVELVDVKSEIKTGEKKAKAFVRS